MQSNNPSSQGSPAETRSVLIVDDHPLFRQGLRLALSDINWLDPISEAGSSSAVLAHMRHSPVDVMLLDIALPDQDGLSLLESLLKQYPNLDVIMVSSYDDRSYVDLALQLGAKGYLVKDCAMDEFQICLQTVVWDKQIFISPGLGARRPRLPEQGNVDDYGTLDSLTPSELKVMALLARCLTSKEIAQELELSPRTVQNHRQKISSKLGVSGMHQLMKIAQRHFPSESVK
jgi:DNA-binding NarL/FixJ family response regulator